MTASERTGTVSVVPLRALKRDALRRDALKRLAAATSLAALLAVGCGGSASTSDVAETSAATAPEADAGATTALPAVSGTLASGGQFELNDLAGQDVVLWFWAPW